MQQRTELPFEWKMRDERRQRDFCVLAKWVGPGSYSHERERLFVAMMNEIRGKDEDKKNECSSTSLYEYLPIKVDGKKEMEDRVLVHV